jgi:hypothetical protein
MEFDEIEKKLCVLSITYERFDLILDRSGCERLDKLLLKTKAMEKSSLLQPKFGYTYKL